MNFEQLYSGSDANLYTVTSTINGKTLLVECGVPIKKLLRAINYNLKDVIGCLLSHEHTDHSQAVYDLIEAGVDVFASAGTFEALGITEGTPFWRRAKVIGDKTVVRFGSNFKVRAFATNHDAAEPLGFVVKEITTSEFMLFATDTSHIKQSFKFPFDVIALECSYDGSILQKRAEAGDIHEEVAKRLLTSHMEKGETIRYLEQFCDLSKCREIDLLHMSRDNIDIGQTKVDFEKRFFIETRIVNEHLQSC